MNLDRKCQVAVEFIVFVGLALLVTIVFVGLSASEAKELHNRKVYFLVRDTALMIQSEIDIASQVEDGYERSFTLSNKLGNIDYNISVNNNVLSVWTENSAYEIAIPNSTGKLILGVNKITKNNNAIQIN